MNESDVFPKCNACVSLAVASMSDRMAAAAAEAV